MSYDTELAERVRDLVVGPDRIVEKKMFGGLAFLLGGHMAVAASGNGGLLVRVDPADAGGWIDGDRVTPMVMRGREMRGWLRVRADADAPDLEEWVERGLQYTRTLPPKDA